MLDAITDFWKSAKKQQAPLKFEPAQLQVGSSLGFGFVPQAMLSGRRLYVIAVNTYVFGDEKLTSFTLAYDKSPDVSGPNVSMIVAESEGEYYLAISRRISINDRAKLFESSALNAIIGNPEKKRFVCKENVVDYKGWVVASYKPEIQGMKGSILKGDFRKAALPAVRDGQEFDYTLLVSESNEHAIEIEKYSDGRIEVYATVYRRVSDVGEITHPALVVPEVRLDVKLASATQILAAASKPTVADKGPETNVAEKVESNPAVTEKVPENKVPEKVAEKIESKPVVEVIHAMTQATPIALEPFALPVTVPNTKEIPNISTNTQPSINGVDLMNAEVIKPKLYVQSNSAETSETSGSSSFDMDAIECDLRVASKIIDEAIRNEMRLTDVVRRIIELPVANPDSVQIPLTLTDEDYALLAIRYGIAATDRNAIKRRIIADLGDFGGAKKAA